MNALILQLLLLVPIVLAQTGTDNADCSSPQNAVDASNAHLSAQWGDVEALQRIATSSPEDLVREDERGNQPIHVAARHGHLQAVQFLLEHGAKVNQRSEGGKGFSPLSLALMERTPTQESTSRPKMIHFLKRVGGLDVMRKHCFHDIGPEASYRPWATPLSHFDVAGVNLALYNQKEEAEQAISDVAEEPFELYSDFDIGDLIRGDETWEDLMEYRQQLERPSLSFYLDKVARKRWLPSMAGFAQPHPYVLRYASELPSGNVEETILSLLPTNASYVAKPTHTSESNGVLLVGVDEDGSTIYSDTVHGVDENGKAIYSNSVGKLSREEEFRPKQVASSLAKSLDEEPYDYESWALFNVRPGFVVEELFTDLDCIECPPLELKIFTIWGRVWTAELTYKDDSGTWCGGFVHRNGTAVAGTAGRFSTVPDWVNWSHLVDVAEKLGAHKDMFRTDMFVGVPAGSTAKTREERLAALQYVVSETEIYPTTVFYPFSEVPEEGARLWVAGYMMGNYQVVPNSEVPPDFLEGGDHAATTGKPPKE